LAARCRRWSVGQVVLRTRKDDLGSEPAIGEMSVFRAKWRMAKVAKDRHSCSPWLISSERDNTTMNVSLPRSQTEFVDQQVQQGSFSTVSDYIRDLIRREQRALAREDLERKLLDGLNSGPSREMAKADWEELRDGLRKRLAGREG
jgi:antitoxin ParD1/3/4